MSQLDGSAISQVTGMALAAAYLDNVKLTDCPVSVLPKDVNIESLECFQKNRFRFRGRMETTSIDDFARYSIGYANAGDPARCFIDAEKMSARSVFNIGTLTAPGHADNVADINLKKTAPFRALLEINGKRLNQKQIAEWLEDWSDFLTAFDASGETMTMAQAASAVRRVSIKQMQESDHEDGDFSGKRSLMQSVEATSKEVMPVAFEFKCVPYEGLNERRFSLRNSLLKSDEPSFVLRIVQLEAQEEDIAIEFRDLLISKFSDESVETFIGSFKA
ncbi:YfdQ family protein [Serratia sp. DD3]|uniref:YfdQ family protein n=1 Tax=Serratia sp. DD3 TaxID=1410619 RepID=UPI0003C4F200|nr:DUF2303 family protein [Serratia sp. DD3]KEY58465.1 hypothetical protein SRDD_27120 [Serratia sp. DD3]